MKKRRIPINPPRLKSKRRRDDAFLDKLLALQVSGKDVLFRKEFEIPDDAFKFEKNLGFRSRDDWLFKLQQDEQKYERYRKRLKELADKFNFKEWETSSLEEYLQTGGEALVLSFSSSDLELEKKESKPTRQVETPFFIVKKISKMQKQGKGYKEIAKYYNQKLKEWGIPGQKVTEEQLRQKYSRTQKRLQQHLEERNRAEEERRQSLKEELS